MKADKYLFIVLFVGAILSGCTASSSEPSAQPKPRPRPLEVTIEMSEYAYTPADIEAEVGQEVTLTLKNVGQLEHELMIGRNVEMHDGVPSGYEVDLFRTAGVIPTVHGGGMLMAHNESGHQDEGGMDMTGEDHEEGMDMAGEDLEEGMDMAGEDHEEGMDMAGEDHEESMDMTGGGHEANLTMDLEGEGALMMMMPVGAEPTTVTFTVTEDMIGEWEMGCFQLDGVHYNSGMVGSFTVTE